MRIAIIGSGVSGLVTAHLLHGHHDVVLYESDDRPGGHSDTHRVELPELTCDVDTGFLVYNERTYPLFCRLLDELGITTQPSDMSFSVADQRTGLEWRGTSFSTVFAQRRNLARPEFLRMLADVGRFNRLARGLLTDPPPDRVTLEEVLAQHRWSAGFRDWYLVPLGSSIWSADPRPSPGSPPPLLPASSSATGCSTCGTSRRGARSTARRGATSTPSCARCAARVDSGSGHRWARSAASPTESRS